jgi:uncharacterized membrane protein
MFLVLAFFNPKYVKLIILGVLNFFSPRHILMPHYRALVTALTVSRNFKHAFEKYFPSCVIFLIDIRLLSYYLGGTDYAPRNCSP